MVAVVTPAAVVMGSSAGTIPFCSWMGDHHCGIPSFKEWWLWAHPTQPRGKLSRSPQVCSWMGEPPNHPHLNGWWWCPPLMPPPWEAQEGLSSSILRWGTPKPSVFEWWRCSPPSVAPWGAQQGLPCFVPGWGVILSSLWGIPIFLGGEGGGIPHSLLAYLYSFRGGVPGWADLHLLGGPSILPHIPEQILSHLIPEWDPSPLNPNPNAPTPPIYTSPRPIHVSPPPHCSLVCLFLKRGADINAVDAEGKDALTIAMELANADIVTL